MLSRIASWAVYQGDLGIKTEEFPQQKQSMNFIQCCWLFFHLFVSNLPLHCYKLKCPLKKESYIVWCYARSIQREKQHRLEALDSRFTGSLHPTLGCSCNFGLGCRRRFHFGLGLCPGFSLSVRLAPRDERPVANSNQEGFGKNCQSQDKKMMFPYTSVMNHCCCTPTWIVPRELLIQWPSAHQNIFTKILESTFIGTVFHRDSVLDHTNPQTGHNNRLFLLYWSCYLRKNTLFNHKWCEITLAGEQATAGLSLAFPSMPSLTLGCGLQ